MAKMPMGHQQYGETGWEVIKKNSSNNPQISYKAKNGFCTVAINCMDYPETYDGANYIWSTTLIPDKYRPQTDLVTYEQSASNERIVCRIEDDGRVGSYSYSSGQKYWGAVITYPTKE